MEPLVVLPYIFDVELSGRCNTACSFCPRHEITRGEEYMSEETFGHVLQNLKTYAHHFDGQELILPFERALTRNGSGVQSVIRVIFAAWGESILHPRCIDYVRELHEQVGIRVSLVTNGLMLTEKRAEALKDAGITVVLVSVPGINRETYSRIMKLDWDHIVNNIKQAHSILGERLQINATMALNSGFSADELLKFWADLGIPVAGLSPCHNRGGYLQDPTLTSNPGLTPHSFCGVFARHNFIAWDGSVLSCCHDLHGENILGHVSQQDFFEIAQRKAPQMVKGPQFSICSRCNDHERCSKEAVISVKQVKLSPTQIEFQSNQTTPD